MQGKRAGGLVFMNKNSDSDSCQEIEHTS